MRGKILASLELKGTIFLSEDDDITVYMCSLYPRRPMAWALGQSLGAEMSKRARKSQEREVASPSPPL